MPPISPVPPPGDETERRRLARLRLLAVLDSQPEPAFDAIARIAAAVAGTPIALISLVDEDRQWFKANLGLDGIAETPRTVAFCAHAIVQDGMLEVPDATRDPRFAGNPLVTGDPNIRFYAGAQITMPAGERMGTVCVIDRVPRTLTPQQRKTLADLAEVAQWALAAREQLHQLATIGDESRFRAISYASPLAVFQTDETGALFYANGRLDELLGLPPQGSLGDGWQQAICAAERQAVVDAWSRTVLAAANFDREFELRPSPGGASHVRIQARPATWGSPLRRGYVGVVADISERKRTEEALRESEERQRRAMAASRLVLWEADAGDRRVYLSENWSAWLGGAQKPTVTDFPSLLALVPEPYRAQTQAVLTRVLTGQAERYEVEHPVRRPDGSVFWIHSEGRVSRHDPARGTLHVTGTNQDITERKQAEAELARAAAITRATLEATADGILVLGPRQEALLHNRKFSAMWRIPPQLERGVDATGLVQHLRSLLKDPQPFDLALAAQHQAQESLDEVELLDGRIFERYGRPIELDGIAGRVWSFRDVTEQRRAERDIRAAKEAAEMANRAKSDFLSNMSHEIRTPLNGVLGMTALLLAEDMAPQHRRLVELADSSGRSLLGLLNDLLDMGKIESGRLELEYVDFDLPGIIAELTQVYALRAAGKGVQFESRSAPDVPLAVRGDPTRLRQVLNNLLSNALKFTSAGRIELDVRRADGASMLAFTVSDTGVGIPVSARDSLFHRFSQGDASTTREFGGTGLGLSIVQHLCEQMGGRVQLASEPGRGTTVRCELPFPQAATAPPAAPAQAVRRPTAADRPERVLVAEDNPTNQVVLRGMLGMAGFRQVDLVANGLEAVEAVQAAGSRPYDVILMDCQMPVLDGYEATRRLRAAGMKVPVIAVTAGASATEREQCLAAGMDDFLPKPLDAAVLAATVRRWAGEERTAPAAPAAAPQEPAEPTWAREEALERVDGDEALLGEVLQSFRDHAPVLVGRMREALARRQQADLRRELHSLAGSAALLGASALHAKARALEELAKGGDIEAVARGIDDLLRRLDAFIAASDPAACS